MLMNWLKTNNMVRRLELPDSFELLGNSKTHGSESLGCTSQQRSGNRPIELY